MAVEVGYYLGPKPVISQKDIATPQNEGGLKAIFRERTQGFCQLLPPSSPSSRGYDSREGFVTFFNSDKRLKF
jgi:hypothetical protein